MRGEKMKKCCLCGNKIYPKVKVSGEYWGHNAQPVKEGRCCDACNLTVVIPARMKKLYLKK
jgi:hypothetical protein